MATTDRMTHNMSTTPRLKQDDNETAIRRVQMFLLVALLAIIAAGVYYYATYDDAAEATSTYTQTSTPVVVKESAQTGVTAVPAGTRPVPENADAIGSGVVAPTTQE